MNKFRNLKPIILVCILAFALVFVGFHLLQAQNKPKKDKPPGKPGPGPNPLIKLQSGDIITDDSDALSVWRYPDSSSDPIWTTETQSYYYFDIAAGDVDYDDEPEIVVPAVKEMHSPGPSVGPFKIFIDVYNEGSEIPLSSENYDGGSFIDPARGVCDITVADVIPNGSGLNEIVILAMQNLAIFQRNGENFLNVERIEATALSLSSFNGMTTKDIDDDGVEEIFVSGTDTFPSGNGYIYQIDMDGPGNPLITPIGSTKDLSIDDCNEVSIGHALRVADLNGDSDLENADLDLEICLPGKCSLGNGYYKAYLLVLDQDQQGSWQWSGHIIIPGYESAKSVYPYIGMDVGELDNATNGEEIAMYINLEERSDYWLYIFKYPFTDNYVFPIYDGYWLQNAYSVNDIKIGNVCNGDENEIVISGSAPPLKGRNLRKYIEVFTYTNQSLSSCWQVPGERGSIDDLAIVK